MHQIPRIESEEQWQYVNAHRARKAIAEFARHLDEPSSLILHNFMKGKSYWGNVNYGGLDVTWANFRDFFEELRSVIRGYRSANQPVEYNPMAKHMTNVMVNATTVLSQWQKKNIPRIKRFPFKVIVKNEVKITGIKERILSVPYSWRKVHENGLAIVEDVFICSAKPRFVIPTVGIDVYEAKVMRWRKPVKKKTIKNHISGVLMFEGRPDLHDEHLAIKWLDKGHIASVHADFNRAVSAVKRQLTNKVDQAIISE